MVRKMIHRYLLTALAALCLTGCDQITANMDGVDDYDQLLEEVKPKKKDALTVNSVKFSPDHKTFTVTTSLNRSIGYNELQDSTEIRSEVKETYDGIPESVLTRPRLIKIENVMSEMINSHKIMLLALVDLTLPQSDINHIREHILEMSTVFKHNNLFLAFMHGKTVSETMPATDYIMDNYFVKGAEDYVYLYRAILEKKTEIVNRLGPWANGRQWVMITFSNDKIYNTETDEPIDPDHYQFEEELIKNDSVNNDTFTAFYSSIRRGDPSDDIQDMGVIRLFCEKSGGEMIKSYNLIHFEDQLFKAFKLPATDYRFTFENPDGKVYRGGVHMLTTNFYSAENDTLISSFSTTITEGNPYNPIIVNGQSLLQVIPQGILLGFAFMLLVYFIIQMVIPHISYRIFLKKYVMHYTGNNMSVQNHMVHESCYLCKAPFVMGEEIVVKCEHTMHKKCWDENDYHCPEYSDRCKHGHHYYNREFLFDHRNAPFYLNWMLMAVIAATVAWTLFTIIAPHTRHVLPYFGQNIAFFLTVGISIMAIRAGHILNKVIEIILRSAVAAILSYFIFRLFDYVDALFPIPGMAFIIDWIPWTASGFIIALCATLRTNIHLRKSLIIISVIIGFLSLYVWTLLYVEIRMDYRVLILFSFIIYAMMLTACIANIAPRSQRYFLKVEGAVKTMDVALYKWFRSNPTMRVTIGKSVECSLQLSWDISSELAPIQAEITMVNERLCLKALEPGVFLNGEPAHLDKEIWLRHGMSFNIGKTTFTYVEKDI